MKLQFLQHTDLSNIIDTFSVHDKFHRTLILSGFCLLKIAKIS
ncbi:TIGR01244 family phosphatase, partial [Acinetobacter baumannii]